MNFEVTSVLEQHKKGEITTSKARDLILVIFGKRQSAQCKLDRLPKDCSIFNNTSSKDCKTCGHFIK